MSAARPFASPAEREKWVEARTDALAGADLLDLLDLLEKAAVASARARSYAAGSRYDAELFAVRRAILRASLR